MDDSFNENCLSIAPTEYLRNIRNNLPQIRLKYWESTEKKLAKIP